MTLCLIVLIVFLFIWLDDVDKRTKAKNKKIEEEKQRNNVNIPLQDELEKKYFDIIMTNLRKADKEKRLFIKGILSVIESTYDNYKIPYEDEAWILNKKTREQYRDKNYEEYRQDIRFNFGLKYDELGDEKFFNSVSLEQIVFNTENPLITKISNSSYLIDKSKSRKYLDDEGNVIRLCHLDVCEHYDDFSPSLACQKCVNCTTYLEYDGSGRCTKLFGNTTQPAIKPLTSVRLISEFVRRATKKELYGLGYSYAWGRFDPNKHKQIAENSFNSLNTVTSKSQNQSMRTTDEIAANDYEWMYGVPPSVEKQKQSSNAKNRASIDFTKAMFYILAIIMLTLSIVLNVIVGNMIAIIIGVVLAIIGFFLLYSGLQYSKSKKNTKK